ncbi:MULTISPECIES: hypothetical protein [unclassified Mesorhizobium]|nr:MULTISPECIES: hypothetical protein [unclassified Mesorhizobium]
MVDLDTVLIAMDALHLLGNEASQHFDFGAPFALVSVTALAMI